jgi:hypothetical protein
MNTITLKEYKILVKDYFVKLGYKKSQISISKHHNSITINLFLPLYDYIDVCKKDNKIRWEYEQEMERLGGAENHSDAMTDYFDYRTKVDYFKYIRFDFKVQDYTLIEARELMESRSVKNRDDLYNYFNIYGRGFADNYDNHKYKFRENYAMCGIYQIWNQESMIEFQAKYTAVNYFIKENNKDVIILKFDKDNNIMNWYEVISRQVELMQYATEHYTYKLAA